MGSSWPRRIWTEDVGCDVADPRQPRGDFEGEPDCFRVNGISVCPCREDPVWIPVSGPYPSEFLNQGWRHGNEALLVSLADDGDEHALGVDVSRAKEPRLADAQPAGVHDREESADDRLAHHLDKLQAVVVRKGLGSLFCLGARSFFLKWASPGQGCF